MNHNGDLETAKLLVDAAVDAKCNAVKFQTFKTEKLVTKRVSKVGYQIQNTHESGTQFDMLKKLELGEYEHRVLFKYCKEKGIGFMSTPFDEESADFLEELGMDIFKIPSGEITNKYFLKHIARKNKTIILSTGMSTFEEVEETVGWIYEEGNRDLALLHCTSCYPAQYDDVNLKAIITLKNCFNLKTGYSDHTLGTEITIGAVAIGAEIIEKHITLDRTMKGPDHRCSLEPEEFKRMVLSIRNMEAALGDGIKKPAESELEVRNLARKYIVADKRIYAGQRISRNMLSLKRSGGGIEPKYIDGIVGAVAVRDLEQGAIIKEGDFELYVSQ
ncbi:N-acetylneuraminate synthase [Pseudobacteroides cellulosolvens ATCC 35603 = DSM 2933]|uniref:N-acetylneuraminate synthase n=1 Tax=Pseudobacteroides cellulosolvens ATCC 35603 = DSM 2933 TaxID=398512 RepID=A0A0L6JT71_9FIRM|nr:N-acetylneuraminate synthase [Pseudobacteroides cellulosolvens ATCC 35603 = DSM 2933]